MERWTRKMIMALVKLTQAGLSFNEILKHNTPLLQHSNTPVCSRQLLSAALPDPEKHYHDFANECSWLKT